MHRLFRLPAKADEEVGAGSVVRDTVNGHVYPCCVGATYANACVYNAVAGVGINYNRRCLVYQEWQVLSKIGFSYFFTSDG